MKITIIGTGYVGLITGTCFAEMGYNVICVDIDESKVQKLGAGELPIYEPGLESLVKGNLRDGRLSFTTSLQEAVAVSNIFFIAVGTPPGADGSADLSHVLGVARQLGRYIDRYSVIVDKSTVPVGTADKVRSAISEELVLRGVQVEFDVVSNPEFLKEGGAVDDFMKPDRIIVGCDSARARQIMHDIYAPFTRSHERIFFMPLRAAEMTKYAANAMLATRISFMNEIAGLCERLGVDVEDVRVGIGSDSRIGYSYIYPGCGYGGSCFPKDVKALVHMGDQNGLSLDILHAVQKRNEEQKQVLFEKVSSYFKGDLSGRTIAVWGLAFKPGTDDMREAPSVELVNALVKAGAMVRAYDPVSMQQARNEFPDGWLSEGKVIFTDNQYGALEGADALVLVTEWKSFRHPDFGRIRELLATPVIFDGRNQYDPAKLKKEGFDYRGIGR